MEAHGGEGKLPCTGQRQMITSASANTLGMRTG